MANHNLSYNGSTGVLEASASVLEKTSTGIARTLHLTVFVKPIDYGGARDFSWRINYAGQEIPGGGALDGAGMIIFDRDITVNVPYDTTSATLDFSFTCTVVSPSHGGRTINGSITKVTGLTLQQGSAKISSVTSTYFGEACSVTWVPSTSTSYNKLKFILGAWSHTTAIFSPGTTAPYTYSEFLIPLDAAQQIPNATSAEMTVMLYTYNDASGSNQIGSTSSSNFTVSLPLSVVPQIKDHNVTVDNSGTGTISDWKTAIAGFSKLRIVANASGAYGSTVSRFIISGAYDESISAESLDYTGRVIQSAGKRQVTIVAVDSRGRKSAPVASEMIDFKSYLAPMISQLTAERNENGYACLKAIFRYDAIDGENKAHAYVYYRRSGSSAAWIKYDKEILNNSTLTTTILLTDDMSFNFKVVVTDTIGNSAAKTAFLSTAKVLLDFKKDGDGLGIGKICENPGMEVSMDTTFYKKVSIFDEKAGEVSLAEYIQSIMKILPKSMYGEGEPPSDAIIGQIYFKKV